MIKIPIRAAPSTGTTTITFPSTRPGNLKSTHPIARPIPPRVALPRRDAAQRCAVLVLILIWRVPTLILLLERALIDEREALELVLHRRGERGGGARQTGGQGGRAGIERARRVRARGEGVGEFGIEVRYVEFAREFGLEGRLGEFPAECVPVDVGEERVRHELLRVALRTEPVRRVAVQQTLDEGAAVGGQGVAREAHLAERDVLVHLLRVLGVEGRPAAAHLEHEHAERPEIDHFGVSLLVQQHFRSEVLRRAAESVGGIVLGQVGL